MIDPNAPFTIDDLRGMNERWLDTIDNCQYWDIYHDKNFDGDINLIDFAIGAGNWAPTIEKSNQVISPAQKSKELKYDPGDYEWLASRKASVPGSIKQAVSAYLAQK